MFKKKPIIAAVICATSSIHAVANEPSSEEKIQVTAPVVVTATRVEQNSFDLPVAIDVVEKKDIQDGQLQMTLSESLIRVPGITAQNRTQMAQDPQISSRGFGSRSAFGVRGVRLYVDGIPLTMPDGQGQPGVVDLNSVRSVEVMRGPFSALYGNSSGGVIQLFTEDPASSPEISAGVLFGSYGTRRQNARTSGTIEGMEYLINYSNFHSDGYRDHSSNNKEMATAKFRFSLAPDTKLTTLVNWFEQDAQDPLGLDRATAFSDPKSANPSALRANTRVARSHTQVGFNLEHRINDNNQITWISYVGNRENLQYLSINPNNAFGRASEISRDFWGQDLRWDNDGSIFGRPYNLSLGVTYGKMNDDRSDINANNGIKTGVINRDEENNARNFDQYAQLKWSPIDPLDIHVGIRRTEVKLEIEDNFVSGSGSLGDNSARNVFQKTTPVLGAIWKINPTFNLYANYGTGFETPTFVEVAFLNANGLGGPNAALKPSESKNYELGAKAYLSDNTLLNLAVFNSITDDEIVTRESGGGRSAFVNAGKTKRKGIELSVDSKLKNDISLYGAYTLLDAKFDDSFTSIVNSNPVTVDSGNTISGTYRTQIYGEIAWQYRPIGFRTALEARYNSKIYVNDTNTESAPSYTIFNLRAGFEQQLNGWRLSEFIRVENLGDREYIGSIRVNDGNGRFYEPAAGRNWLLGLSAAYQF
jgi:iron complex outermembrane recepter protein